MKIVAIHETVAPISSDIRNAYIDFSKMTASVVAVVTDVKRNGKRVVGYGFNSNGRYAQSGLLRERFIPRIMAARSSDLVNDTGDNLDPHKIWACAMANEKPGGHGERSVAVGVLDMAVWDAVAKIEQKPLYRLLGERYRGGTVDDKVFVYAAGGYYYPGKNILALQNEIKKYLDLGYTVVKIKIGGESLADDIKRIEAVIKVVGAGSNLAVDAWPFRSQDGARVCRRVETVRTVLVRRSWRPARLCPAGGIRKSLQRFHGDRRESVLDAGCAQSHSPRRHARRS